MHGSCMYPRLPPGTASSPTADPQMPVPERSIGPKSCAGLNTTWLRRQQPGLAPPLGRGKQRAETASAHALEVRGSLGTEGKEGVSFLLSLFPEDEPKSGRVQSPPPASVFSLAPAGIRDTMVMGGIEMEINCQKGMCSLLPAASWRLQSVSHLFSICSQVTLDREEGAVTTGFRANLDARQALLRI